MWFLVLLKLYPLLLRDREEVVCISYKVLHDTATLTEEERVSQGQYQLLTRNLHEEYTAL